MGPLKPIHCAGTAMRCVILPPFKKMARGILHRIFPETFCKSCAKNKKISLFASNAIITGIFMQFLQLAILLRIVSMCCKIMQSCEINEQSALFCNTPLMRQKMKNLVLCSQNYRPKSREKDSFQEQCVVHFCMLRKQSSLGEEQKKSTKTK